MLHNFQELLIGLLEVKRTEDTLFKIHVCARGCDSCMHDLLQVVIFDAIITHNALPSADITGVTLAGTT